MMGSALAASRVLQSEDTASCSTIINFQGEDFLHDLRLPSGTQVQTQKMDVFLCSSQVTASLKKLKSAAKTDLSVLSARI